MNKKLTLAIAVGAIATVSTTTAYADTIASSSSSDKSELTTASKAGGLATDTRESELATVQSPSVSRSAAQIIADSQVADLVASASQVNTSANVAKSQAVMSTAAANDAITSTVSVIESSAAVVNDAVSTAQSDVDSASAVYDEKAEALSSATVDTTTQSAAVSLAQDAVTSATTAVSDATMSSAAVDTKINSAASVIDTTKVAIADQAQAQASASSAVDVAQLAADVAMSSQAVIASMASSSADVATSTAEVAATTSTAIDDTQIQVVTIEAQITAAIQARNDAQSKIDDLNSEITTTTQSVTDLTAAKKEADATLETTQATLASLQARLSVAEANLAVSNDYNRDQNTRDQGVDWSSYQGANGVTNPSHKTEFTIIKVGGYEDGGNYYTSPVFDSQVQAAVKLGARVHSYIYYAVGGDATLGARVAGHFTSKVARNPSVLSGSIIALDYESNFSSSKEANTQAALAGMRQIASKGYTPMLYASSSMIQNNFNAAEILAEFPDSFWVASYMTTKGVDQDASDNYDYFPNIDGIAIWQFSRLAGVNGSGLDADVDLTGITYKGYGAVRSQTQEDDVLALQAQVAAAQSVVTAAHTQVKVSAVALENANAALVVAKTALTKEQNIVTISNRAIGLATNQLANAKKQAAIIKAAYETAQVKAAVADVANVSAQADLENANNALAKSTEHLAKVRADYTLVSDITALHTKLAQAQAELKKEQTNKVVVNQTVTDAKVALDNAQKTLTEAKKALDLAEECKSSASQLKTSAAAEVTVKTAILAVMQKAFAEAEDKIAILQNEKIMNDAALTKEIANIEAERIAKLADIQAKILAVKSMPDVAAISAQTTIDAINAKYDEQEVATTEAQQILSSLVEASTKDATLSGDAIYLLKAQAQLLSLQTQATILAKTNSNINLKNQVTAAIKVLKTDIDIVQVRDTKLAKQNHDKVNYVTRLKREISNRMALDPKILMIPATSTIGRNMTSTEMTRMTRLHSIEATLPETDGQSDAVLSLIGIILLGLASAGLLKNNY